MSRANELELHVGFYEDPTNILAAYQYLKDPPPPYVRLHSNLEGTVNGLLPWQITGYNKLIKNEDIKASIVAWCVGAGKTAAMASAILHHRHEHPFDIAFCVVKSHNKIDTQRKLKSLADIDATIIDGPKQKRVAAYQDLIGKTDSVIILNYEKIREDFEDMIPLVTDRGCLFFLDEAPTKLANRQTQLYKSVKKLLYSSFPNKPRPAWMRHWALTATPVENSPEDVWSVVNLMRPGSLGTIKDFYNKYVASTSFFSGKPDSWKNLDAFEARLQFMTHRVSKDDPQVKAMFPDVIDHPLTIDWNHKHLSIYDKITGRAQDMVDGMDDVNILALIQILQMMCDAPSMIRTSANNRTAFYEMLDNLGQGDHIPGVTQGSDVALMLIDALGADTFTDEGHSKLATWGEIITVKHPEDKIVTHSTWADYIFPVWTNYLDSLGVSYVVYRGSTKEKQEALDAFRNDPSIRCFLSGDAGSDSIDISEAAVGVNYNIPWKWTTLQQREGRRDRVNSNHEQIHTYTLTMPFSVDERKMDICQRKYAYHAQLFDGKAKEEVLSARLTRADLLYMLFG